MIKSKISYTRQRPVMQLTLQGHQVRQFDHAEQAAEALGRTIGRALSAETIRSCASGSSKSAYGYLWRYLNHDPKTTLK